MKLKTFGFVLLALLLPLFLVPVPASAMLSLPHAFYGDVTVNDKPAPAGIATIEARGTGVLTGIEGNPVNTSTLGKYGSTTSPELDLIVQGDIQDGATITFYINGVSTGKTTEWHSGETTKLDLSAYIEHTLIVTASPAKGGTVTGSGTYDWNTNQPITATAAAGYEFNGWMGSGIANPASPTTTVYIDMDKTVTANFSAPPAPSPAAEEALPPGTTDVRGRVSSAGVFLEPVTATSEDELCTLTVPEGTVGLTEDLEPLTEITIVIMDEPPPPPEAANIIGLTYDLGPDRANFDPPITLTWSYDPADIPEGIAAEDLVIAYYDEVTGEWVELDCVVDTENNTITAPVSHFTTFAIIAVAPPPPEEEEVAPPKEKVVSPEEEEEVVVVTEEEEEVPPEEEEITAPEEEEELIPEPAKPINWALIGGIIGAAVLVIVLITLFWVRRRAY